MGSVRWLWMVWLFALGLPAFADSSAPTPAPAPTLSVPADATDQRIWFTTVYASQWVSTSLPQIPYAGVTGSLSTAATYFAGLGLGRELTPFNLPMPFCSCGINGFRLEVEGQFTKHFGLEHEVEGAAALVFRSPQVPLFLGLSFNAAIGEGGSYDFTLPAFEGSVAAYGPRAPGPRKFLNFMIYEFEFTQERWKDLHFVLQIHHRSGIWGVIAPKGTGGNYLGVGIRADFQ